MSTSFITALPLAAETGNIRALASFTRDVRTPANTTTVLVFDNPLIPGFEQVWKNGTLLSPTSAYTVKANKITLTVAANGTDEYQVRYYFVNN